MQEILDYLTEFNALSVLIRVIVAAIAGGLVGIERELHGRAAGMRTHMMVCLGAALTTMIGIFDLKVLSIDWADPMRIGAQVISGVGFIGAGTILLKKGSSQIRGLTTAAGLWVTAVIGLAIGAGFFEGAILTVIAVMLSFTLVYRLEIKMNNKRQRLFVYLEVEHIDVVKDTIAELKAHFGAAELQVTQPRSGTQSHVGIEALIRAELKGSIDEKIDHLQNIPHVIFAIQIT